MGQILICAAGLHEACIDSVHIAAASAHVWVMQLALYDMCLHSLYNESRPGMLVLLHYAAESVMHVSADWCFPVHGFVAGTMTTQALYSNNYMCDKWVQLSEWQGHLRATVLTCVMYCHRCVPGIRLP